MRGVYAPSYVGRNQPFFKADRNASVGLYLQSRLHHALPFFQERTRYTQHGKPLAEQVGFEPTRVFHA